MTFGSYARYDPAEAFFGHYSAKGMLDFAARHWLAYAGWIGTLLVPPILFALARRREGRAVAYGNAVPARSTFVPWFYVTLAAAFGLTLIWGMKQDGDMYYYNAFFNYSIYYGLTLGLAGSAAVLLQSYVGRSDMAAVRRVICAALWVGAGAVVAGEAAEFKEHAGSLPADQLAAESVSRAAAATVPPGGTCYLRWSPWEIWPSAIAVALQLERSGREVRVDDDLAILFGKNRTLSGRALDLSRPLVCWRVAPVSQDPARLGRWPVGQDCGIEAQALPDLNPAGGRIRFAAGGNFMDYVVFGWSETTVDWDWSDEREALLQFHPGPLPADAGGVDMVFDAWSYFKPGSPQPQRVETIFNGVRLETAELPVAVNAPAKARVHIDAARWREAAARGGVALHLIFPDAKSPFELGLSTDRRPLGGGFRSIGFELTVGSTPVVPQSSSGTR